MVQEQQDAAMRVALTALFAGMLAAATAGCVSSTLNTNDFRPVGGQTAASPAAAPQQSVQPQALAPQQTEPQPLPQVSSQTAPQPGNSDETATGSVADPVKRQQALNEIRTKAAASSGQKTQIGAVPASAIRQMSSQEQAEMATQLENSRQSTGTELSDAEIEARKASIRRLQKRGETHYQQTLEAIEK